MLVKKRSEKAYGRSSLIRVNPLVFVKLGKSLLVASPNSAEGLKTGHCFLRCGFRAASNSALSSVPEHCKYSVWWRGGKNVINVGVTFPHYLLYLLTYLLYLLTKPFAPEYIRQAKGWITLITASGCQLWTVSFGGSPCIDTPIPGNWKWFYVYCSPSSGQIGFDFCTNDLWSWRTFRLGVLWIWESQGERIKKSVQIFIP